MPIIVYTFYTDVTSVDLISIWIYIHGTICKFVNKKFVST